MQTRSQITATATDLRVCTDHFEDTQFYSPGKKMGLKENEVPTRNLPCVVTIQFDDELYSKMKTRIETLKRKVKKLKSVIQHQRRKISQSQINYQQSWVRSQRIKRKMQTQADQLTSKLLKVNAKIEHDDRSLGKCFTNGQIRMLRSSKKKISWTDEDISRAIVLKSISSSAYQLVRSGWKVPLPGISTLQKWVSKIDFQPGVIAPVISLLKEKFKNASLFERQCVLCFDEMSLDGLVGYDMKHDSIIGPHSNLMVMHVRGLFSNWKQPIFFDFDCKFTRPVIQEILTQLNSCGLEVRAMTCDMCPSNTVLSKELDFSVDKTYFVCPASGRKIWVFFDVPHIIKRFRDNTIDYTITLADGTKYNVDDFRQITNNDCNEIRVCHKLTPKHLNLHGRERMHVRSAMQLYSASVANCFRQFFGFDKRLLRLADHVQLVNDYTDILNTRHTGQKNFCGSPEQLKVLDAMEFEIERLRVGNSNHRLPFQTGCLYSIRSLKGLFADVSQPPLSATYIMTNHLNQDIAENSFSIIRGIGRFDNTPSALRAVYDLKILMLGWTFKPSKKTSTENEIGTTPYVTSGLLRSLMSPTQGPSLHPEPEQVQNRMESIDPLMKTGATEDTWADFHDCSDFRGKFGLQAQEYVYGYIISKLKHKYPEMVLSADLSERFPQTWVQRVSKNHTVPSYTWLNIFKKFEDYFLAFHSRLEHDKFDVNRGPGVCKRLSIMLQSTFPDVPEDIISTFVRVRTMIRIKAVNNELKKLRFRRSKKAAQFVKSFVPNNISQFPSLPNVEPSSQIPSEDEEQDEVEVPAGRSDWDSVCDVLEDLSLASDYP